MKFSAFLLAVLAAPTLVVAACGGGKKVSPAASPGPGPGRVRIDHGVTDLEIRVGSTAGKSGGYTLGIPYHAAMNAYFNKVNQEDGGVCGRRIRFIGEDDQGMASLALDRARKLVERDDVLVMNAYRTTAVMGSASYLNDPDGDGNPSDGIPYLWTVGGAAETADPSKWPWGPIQIQPLYEDVGRTIAEALNRQFPQASAAILFQNDDFGRGAMTGFKQSFRGRVVAEQAVDPSAPDISGQLATLRAASPDLLVVAVTGGFMPRLYRYRTSQAWNVQTVWLYPFGGTAVLTQALGGADPASQQAVLGMIVGTILGQFLLDPYADKDTPAMREHVRILGIYGGGQPVNEYTIVGQAVAEAMVETLRRACDRGDLTRKGVLAAAETMAGFHPTVFKPGVNLETSPRRHVGPTTVFTGQVQADGSITLLQ